MDNTPVLNTGKAGHAVPLEWHLDDASGQPVTTLTEATVKVSVHNLDCGLTTTADGLERTFAGGSGLQDLGQGNCQLNWKTTTTWARSCKVMTLDLGGGITKQANFKFTK